MCTDKAMSRPKHRFSTCYSGINHCNLQGPTGTLQNCFPGAPSTLGLLTLESNFYQENVLCATRYILFIQGKRCYLFLFSKIYKLRS